MRFLIDMLLSPALAVWLCGLGHDAAHAGSLGLAKAEDARILAYARAEDATVITADLDFPRLLASLGADAPSLVLLRGGDYSDREAIDCVRRVLMALDPAELARSIVVVEKTRIRRRRLPI